MDAVSEIKARLPIEELVGSYCQLQRKGRTLKALCPFHNDTHPSLTVSPDRGIAYCFVCQSGGDIFSFYQKIENVDFVQALKDLAERAGVVLPKGRFREGMKKDEKEQLRSCLEAACSFYQSTLRGSDQARAYLRGRQMPEELITTFRVGYAPDSFDATYTHLLHAGFSRKEILGAGLGIQKELQEERIYDRFRNRIMFPITDSQGNIIGFGGRALGNDDAKYINSPDGPLYSKSSALFGFSLAREAIREKKCVILVEGYFDVLACHRLGIRNVVAQCGTALTEQHAVLLQRAAERVCLCLDADAAGAQAAERAYMLLAKHALAVTVLPLPRGKDPDECAALAPAELCHACEERGVPFLDHVLRELAAAPLEKRSILRRCLPLLQCIPYAVEREGAIQGVARLLGTTPTAVEDDLRRERLISERTIERKGQEAQTPLRSIEVLFGLLLLHPHHLPLLRNLIEPQDEADRPLFRALAALSEGGGGPGTPRDVLAPLPPEVRERASVLQLWAEEHFSSFSESMISRELQKLLRRVNRGMLLQKQKELLENLKQARSLGRKLEEQQLLTQYQKVLKLTQFAS